MIYEDNDDPICARCGVFYSEHGMEPCIGFQTEEQFQSNVNWYANLSEDERWALDEYEAHGGIIY